MEKLCSLRLVIGLVVLSGLSIVGSPVGSAQPAHSKDGLLHGPLAAPPVQEGQRPEQSQGPSDSTELARFLDPIMVQAMEQWQTDLDQRIRDRAEFILSSAALAKLEAFQTAQRTATSVFTSALTDDTSTLPVANGSPPQN